MADKLQGVRGMNDILPEDLPYWYKLEHTAADIFRSYGYQEIRTPVLEKTELFSRSIGDVTDIVEKEMYTFDDRSGESLSLRPEGTASIARACLQHGLLHNQQQRLWYTGPMFRYERPQAGRYRQFHQIALEAYGFAGPELEAEQLMLTWRLWQALGIKDVKLHINSLGTSESRAKYRDALVSFYQQNADKLDEDSKRRLDRNPLRILDSKDPAVSELNQSAPKIQDYLDEESSNHFSTLCDYLNAVDIPFTVDSRLVRGIDYYTNTVYEWVTDSLGAQGTICGGGRYDGLVEQIGGKPTPGVGFGIGIERVILMLKQQKQLSAALNDGYVVVMDTAFHTHAVKLVEKLRDVIPGVRIVTHAGGGSVKSQFKKADKSNAQLALILGEEEINSNKTNVKYLRESKDQETVNFDELTNILREYKSNRITEWGE